MNLSLVASGTRVKRRSPGTDFEKEASTRSDQAVRPWVGPGCVGLVLATASVLVSLVFWPGMVDGDTPPELRQAATGHFSDWHVPTLEALWRVLMLAGLHGSGWVLLAGVFSLLIGFYLILRVRFSRVISTVVTLLCCAFPPVLTWAAAVDDDAWFTAAILAGFGFVARVARTNGRSRSFSIVAAIWFAAIALAARHNAAPAVLILFIALAAAWSPTPVRARRKKKVAIAIAAVVATVSLLLVESGFQRAIGTRSTHPVQASFIYDLAQLSKEEHQVLFPRSIDPSQDYGAISQYSNVYEINGLIFGKDATVSFFLRGKQMAALQNAWEKALLHYPLGYLRERGSLALSMFSISHPSYWIANPASSAIPPEFKTANHDGYTYLAFLSEPGQPEYGDFLYDGWIYALLLAIGGVEFWRRKFSNQVVAWLAIGILVYTVVLVFSGPGELYRYIYPMVATGTVVTPLLLADLVGFIVRRYNESQRVQTRGVHARAASASPGSSGRRVAAYAFYPPRRQGGGDAPLSEAVVESPFVQGGDVDDKKTLR